MKESSISLTDTLTLLIHEIIKHTQEFSRFDINRILVCCSRNRPGSVGGIYGKLVPLRFEGGAEIVKHNDNYYTIPRVKINGIEVLYIIYFYIPKFFNLPAKEKLKIIFHELYHIDPGFSGDIRRMGGKKSFHGHSKEKFDEEWAAMAEKFYEKINDTSFMAFLDLDTESLKRKFKSVNYKRMKKPAPVIIYPN